MGYIDDLRNSFDGTYGLPAGASSAFNAMTDFCVEYVKASADSMAADTTAATKFWCNGFGFSLSIVSGKISPNATLTAHDDNNAVITVERDDAANGTPAAALTWNTDTTGGGGTGNWAVDTPVPNVSRTAANSIMVAGSNLFFAIAKGGTGVVVPAHRGSILLRRVGG
jgi:hypothetical protein